ncbi:MAG: Secreted protein [Parcubacteria group bacterium GW2011_GWC2_42_6]|nr:MAG: Secreted protein [Parcubacteria group bacterium GW2011_GWC2_42_6]
MRKIGFFLLFLLIVMALVGSAKVFAGGGIMFTWEPPTTHGDGTPETNLAGYKLYWGSASRFYTKSMTATYCRACPSPSSTIVERECVAFQPGTYYVAATALDTDGRESGYSNEVIVTIPAAVNPLGNCALAPLSTLCRVDGYDLIFLNKNFGKTILGPACTETNYAIWKTIQSADVNNDGIIDGVDKGIVSANFGQTRSPCP